MALLFKRISGVRGKLIIPDLDALVGEMDRWELIRRGADSGTHRYDLRAVFHFLNVPLYNDEDYLDQREVRIVLGRTKEFRARLSEAEETVLTGRVLLVRGVKIYEREDARPARAV